MQKAKKAQTVAQKRKAQGAIEYLLIISAAIIIVAIVIASMVNTIQMGENQGNAAASGYNSKLTDLDKMKKSIFIKVNLQAGENKITLPNEVVAQELPIVFLYAPKGTQVSFGGETYTKESEAPPLPAEDAMQSPINGKVENLFFEDAQIWKDSQGNTVSDLKIPCGTQMTVTVSSSYTLPIRKNSINGPCVNYDSSSDPGNEDPNPEITIASLTSIDLIGADQSTPSGLFFANNTDIKYNFLLKGISTVNAPSTRCHIKTMIGTITTDTVASSTSQENDEINYAYSQSYTAPLPSESPVELNYQAYCIFSDNSRIDSEIKTIKIYPEIYLISARAGNMNEYIDINYVKSIIDPIEVYDLRGNPEMFVRSFASLAGDTSGRIYTKCQNTNEYNQNESNTQFNYYYIGGTKTGIISSSIILTQYCFFDSPSNGTIGDQVTVIDPRRGIKICYSGTSKCSNYVTVENLSAD
jgi:hypothetical protein